MKYRLVILSVLMLLTSIISVSALSFTKNIPLVNEIESEASGSLTMRQTYLTSGKSIGFLSLKVKKLLPEENRYYEVWLVDNESNYHWNAGILEVNKRGNGIFKMRKDGKDILYFDQIIITQEDEPDFELHPGRHILSADLPFNENEEESD